MIFMKFYNWVFFENVLRKVKFYECLTRMKGTLHEDQNTFWSYLAQFFLRWEMCRKNVVQKIKTHFIFKKVFSSKIVPFMRWCRKWLYSQTPRMIIRRMRMACWIPKATNKNTEYVILIAFPLQKMVAPTRLSITLYVYYLSCNITFSPNVRRSFGK
jgi:hypothetical protein